MRARTWLFPDFCRASLRSLSIWCEIEHWYQRFCRMWPLRVWRVCTVEICGHLATSKLLIKKLFSLKAHSSLSFSYSFFFYSLKSNLFLGLSQFIFVAIFCYWSDMLLATEATCFLLLKLVVSEWDWRKGFDLWTLWALPAFAIQQQLLPGTSHKNWRRCKRALAARRGQPNRSFSLKSIATFVPVADDLRKLPCGEYSRLELVLHTVFPFFLRLQSEDRSHRSTPCWVPAKGSPKRFCSSKIGSPRSVLVWFVSSTITNRYCE